MEGLLTPFQITNSNLFKIKQNAIIDTELKPENFKPIINLLRQIELITKNKASNEMVKNVINSLKNDNFNLTGQLIEITQALHPEQENLFETELIITNRNIIYRVYFAKITEKFAQNLNKLPKKTTMYIMGVKANISFMNDNAQLKFLFQNKSKIFYTRDSISDDESPLLFNAEITQVYEDRISLIRERKAIEQDRITNSNNLIITSVSKNQTTNEISTNNPTQKKYVSLFDIISDPELKQKLSTEITEEEKKIHTFLCKKTNRTIFNIKTINDSVKDINFIPKRVNVVGLITGIREEPRVTSVEITSLIDSNSIKLIHYPNNWKFKPQKRHIISVKQIPLKINKNLEFILENPKIDSVVTLGELNEKEYSQVTQFRFDNDNGNNFSTIIELLQPIMVREIRKYFITIKDVLKISARFDNDDLKDESFRLFGKCIIDDGSFEAGLSLYDDTCIKLLGYDADSLAEVKELTKTSKNLILYQKTSQSNYFQKEQLENLYDKQFILYAVPFSKIATKHFNENKINRYFMNLGEKNHLIKNRAMNSAFLNGDMFYEKDIPINEMTLIPKPLLRAIHLQEVN